MERLTEKSAVGWGIPNSALNKIGARAYGAAANKLAEYEDTGLTPEEVVEQSKRIAVLESRKQRVLKMLNGYRKSAQIHPYDSEEETQGFIAAMEIAINAVELLSQAEKENSRGG